MKEVTAIGENVKSLMSPTLYSWAGTKTRVALFAS